MLGIVLVSIIALPVALPRPEIFDPFELLPPPQPNGLAYVASLASYDLNLNHSPSWGLATGACAVNLGTGFAVLWSAGYVELYNETPPDSPLMPYFVFPTITESAGIAWVPDSYPGNLAVIDLHGTISYHDVATGDFRGYDDVPSIDGVKEMTFDPLRDRFLINTDATYSWHRGDTDVTLLLDTPSNPDPACFLDLDLPDQPVYDVLYDGPFIHHHVDPATGDISEIGLAFVVYGISTPSESLVPWGIAFTRNYVYTVTAGEPPPDSGNNWLGVHTNHYQGLINFGGPASCPYSCGDTDGSGGSVDISDFLTFALCFGLAAPDPPTCDYHGLSCSDLDHSGAVDLVDFATFAVWFGLQSTSTPPNCLD